jgi:hypothetical protein
MSETIIIAPHCDDEIIGCYSILSNRNIHPIIIYTEDTDSIRKEEALKLPYYCYIKDQVFEPVIADRYINYDTTFYFPGPDEIHPAHRKMAAIGEEMARKGFNIIFYSTNMNVKWIKEVQNPELKKNTLETIYSSQSDLWKYEHKYFLFEAYCKWIF